MYKMYSLVNIVCQLLMSCTPDPWPLCDNNFYRCVIIMPTLSSLEISILREIPIFRGRWIFETTLYQLISVDLHVPCSE